MRVRLRETADFDALYTNIYDHTKWNDHRVRVRVTAGVAAWFHGIHTMADLSCGDAAIANMIGQAIPLTKTYLGDYVPGYEFTGPIEQTIEQIPSVDLFVLSETIEHLEDPDQVLRRIRNKTKHLILSTPDGETGTDNPEHLWGWDNQEMKAMLQAAGFNQQVYLSLSFPANPYYTFQIWGCS